MALQKLMEVVTVGPLAPGAQVTINTGIHENGGPRAALFVMPDEATPISVLGNPFATPLSDALTFINNGSVAETATFFCWRIHSVLGVDTDPGHYWRGLGATLAAVVAGGAAGGAMFYGLTAGTGNPGATDYAATVAVNAAMPFPRLGPTSVGFGVVPGGVNQFVLPTTGRWKVSWTVEFLEASQLLVKLGAAEVPHTLAFSGAGTQQNSNTVIIDAVAGDLLSIVNASGNAAALTVQTADGNHTHAQAPSLVIEKVA